MENLPSHSRFAQPLLGLILITYVGLALGYVLVRPLFEAPDEHLHYFTAQYIAENGRLPSVAPGDNYDRWLGQEAAQPPLYYLLGAALIAPLDTADSRTQVWVNPFAAIGDPSALNNVNWVVHTEREHWPWHGYVLAANLLRGLSALLGAGTLLCIYGSGRLLWPQDHKPALLATALVAFLPQFTFIHTSVSNDTLITCLSSVTIWQLLRLWLSGVTRARLLLLGISIGLAALTKTAGILLILYAVGVLVLLAMRNGRYQLVGETAVFVILPVLVMAGWLWWRNWMLYGDPTAANQFIRLAGGSRNYTLGQVVGESSGLWLSLFAVFGWFNLQPPQWVYVVWHLIVGIAVIAGIWRLEIGDWGLGSWSAQTFVGGVRLWLRRRRIVSLLLGGWVLVVYGGLVSFMMRTEAAQGRLLFPALAPMALGLAYGLIRFPWRSVRWLAPPAALVTSVYCLVFVIRPAYARPPAVAALPETAVRLEQPVGKGLELVGVEAPERLPTARPGDIVWFTLYWRAHDIPADTPEFVLELFGRSQGHAFAKIGGLHSYHGRGLYPANLWLPDTLIADHFPIRVAPDAEAPALARAFARLADGGNGIDVGSVKIVPHTWPDAGKRLAHIGDGIVLTAVTLSQEVVQPGDTLDVYVTWRVIAAPGRDLTTLVHLGAGGRPPLQAADSPPLSGGYPTRVWAVGEVIEDRYTLPAPPDLANGRYPIWIGMYDSETITRLPLAVNGVRQPNDTYLAGWIEVEE